MGSNSHIWLLRRRTGEPNRLGRRTSATSRALIPRPAPAGAATRPRRPRRTRPSGHPARDPAVPVPPARAPPPIATHTSGSRRHLVHGFGVIGGGEEPSGKASAVPMAAAQASRARDLRVPSSDEVVAQRRRRRRPPPVGRQVAMTAIPSATIAAMRAEVRGGKPTPEVWARTLGNEASREAPNNSAASRKNNAPVAASPSPERQVRKRSRESGATERKRTTDTEQ